MEIVVLVLGIVGFIMSFVIVGAIPAALAIILGVGRLLVKIKKKPLRKMARVEIIIGLVFAALAVIVSLYVYFAGVMNIDFVKIVRQDIKDIGDWFSNIF